LQYIIGIILGRGDRSKRNQALVHQVEVTTIITLKERFTIPTCILSSFQLGHLGRSLDKSCLALPATAWTQGGTLPPVDHLPDEIPAAIPRTVEEGLGMLALGLEQG